MPLKEDVCHAREQLDINRVKAGEQVSELFLNSVTFRPEAHTFADNKHTELRTLYCKRTGAIIADVSHGNVFTVITPLGIWMQT